MKILIVVPTLNSYQILPKLVKSLNLQTFKEWRVIFVDGESSEKHKKWLKLFCSNNSKYSYVNQKKSKGIFGAMNEGYNLALEDEWVLFWGSDDWCKSPETFENLNNLINNFLDEKENIDFVICKGRYFEISSKKLGRISEFSNLENKLISGSEFRNKLKSGFSPPHQGVLFTPRINRKKFSYDEEYKIAADLEFFLRISKNDDFCVLLLNHELVYMSDNGVSSKAIIKKYREVLKAYKSTFGKVFLLVFLKRYLQKINLLLSR